MALARSNSQGVLQLRRFFQVSSRFLSAHLNSGSDGERAAPGGQFRELGRAHVYSMPPPFLPFEFFREDERRARDGSIEGGFRVGSGMIFPRETDMGADSSARNVVCFLFEKTSQSSAHKFWSSSFESAFIRVSDEESDSQARPCSPTSGVSNASQVGTSSFSHCNVYGGLKQEQFLRGRTPQAILLGPFSRGRHESASFSTASNAGVSADPEEEVAQANKKANSTASVGGVSWVEKALPNQLKPYAYLARLDKPIGTWLLAWPCFW